MNDNALTASWPAGRAIKGVSSAGLVGMLGGLIGLGGAEFRLPLLVGLFALPALEAVILNKVISLVVVSVSLPFRSSQIPWQQVISHWPVILNLLAGSLIGAWLGAHQASRLPARWLNRCILLLLLALGLGMLLGHELTAPAAHALVTLTPGLMLAGLLAGLGIGLVAAFLGVAGGELIIPTLVLLFGVDVKLAGSLSLCISLPTMLVAFARYRQTAAFDVCRRERHLLGWMILGSIAGAGIGSQLLGLIPADRLLQVLGVLLLLSAIKVFCHRQPGR